MPDARDLPVDTGVNVEGEKTHSVWSTVERLPAGIWTFLDEDVGDPNAYGIAATSAPQPPPPGDLFLRGDDDSDGNLSIGDAIFSLSFQFLGSVVPLCRDSLDFNDDQKIDVSDPVGNLSHQFLGQDPPAPPGKEACGLDPTEDDLDCTEYPEENCQ